MFKFIQINICSTSLYFIHFPSRPIFGLIRDIAAGHRSEEGLKQCRVASKVYRRHMSSTKATTITTITTHGAWLWKDVENYGITGATAQTPSIMSCESQMEPMEVQLNPRNHECSIPHCQPMTHFRPEWTSRSPASARWVRIFQNDSGKGDAIGWLQWSLKHLWSDMNKSLSPWSCRYLTGLVDIHIIYIYK